MFIKICLFIILSYFSSNVITESEIPSSIQHCRRKSTDFLDCALKAEQDAIKLFKNGYPEKDIEPLEPIKADSIIIKGKPNRQFRLDQFYKNVKIYGFTGVILKPLQGSIDECVFHQNIYFPRVEIHSDYEINGKLLLISVNGAGKSNVTLKGVASQIILTCEFYKENNIEYATFKDLQFKIKAKNVYLNFENIVNGNIELSDVLQKIINENANELFMEYNEPYAKIISEQLLSRARKFIKDVPVSKLFLPEL